MPHSPRVAQLTWTRGARSSRVAVRLWGADEPGRPAVVCVHGLSRNAQDFDELAAALAPRFGVVCIDMPGRGDSERLPDPADYGSDTNMAVALHVMDSLGLAQVHWVGTSMGGLLGMRIAAQLPQRIRSLVMNDVGAELDAGELARQRSRAAEQVTFAQAPAAGEYLRERYSEFGIRDAARWERFIASSIEQHPDGRWRLRFDARAVPAAPTGAQVSLWDQYTAVRCPVLVLRGSHSRLLSRATCERMADTGPRAACVEFEGAGHAPDLSGADRLEPVMKFLEKVR